MRTIFLTLLLVLCPIASRGASLERTADHAAKQAMKDFNLPGLAIAVVQDDRVILVRGYGVQATGHPEAVTADTLFELGSTTKAFTTAGMAVLVTDGVMTWDDPVSTHLPYFHLADRCSDSLITLRDLVSHRSGVSRHDELWEATDWSSAELVRIVAGLKPASPIRSGYQYNNVMFVAAGEAAASTAGVPYEIFMKRRLFEPLGMTSTVITMDDWSRSSHAQGHTWSEVEHKAALRPMNDYSVIAAAGTVKTTARDLSRWLRFQLGDGQIDGRRIASADALNETKKPQSIVPFAGFSREIQPETNLLTYGMGWNVQDYRGELLVAHGGVLNGFRSNVALLPERKLGIAIMTNIERGYALYAIRNEILDAVLRSGERDWDRWYLDIERKSDARDAAATAERLAKRTAVGRSLSDYAGTYRHDTLGEAVVTARGEEILLQWKEVSSPLSTQAADTFHLQADDYDIDEDIRFTADAGGVVSLRMFGEEFVRLR